MFLAYKIGNDASRLPVFTLLLLLTALSVYIFLNDISLIPYSNDKQMGSISERRAERVKMIDCLLGEKKGDNETNRLISLFFSQHLMQFFVEFWLAFILMTYIEMRIGRVPFIILYLIFAGLLNLLAKLGLYSTALPYPFLQGMVLMLCGYFYVNHFRENIKIAYFIAPIESLKGKYEMKAVYFILPFYFTYQMIMIFIALMGSLLPIVSFGLLLKSADISGIPAVIHNSLLYFPYPSSGMFFNILLCPLIGAGVGLIFGRLTELKAVERIFQVPDGERYSVSRKHEKDFNMLNSSDLKIVSKGAAKLETEFALKTDPDIFERLYEYYSKKNLSEKKMKLADFYLGKLSFEEERKEIFEAYIVMKNNGDENLVNELKPAGKAKIIRVLYEGHLFEEARAYLDVIKERQESDKTLTELTDYLDSRKFDY